MCTHLPYSDTAQQPQGWITRPTLPITSCCCSGNNDHIGVSCHRTARTWESERKPRPNNPKPTVYQPGAGLMSPERALTLLRHFEVNLLAPEFRHCPRPAPGQSRRRRAEHSGSSSADPGLQKSSTWNAESWDAQEQNQLPNRPELQHQDHSHCSQPHLEGCQRSLASVLVLHIGVKHDAQPTVGSCLGLGPVLQPAE